MSTRGPGHPRIPQTFDRIAGFWIEGADLPPVRLEDPVDAAARAGDEIALAAALDAYEQAARASYTRRAPAIDREARA